jgi:hypothetical protein
MDQHDVRIRLETRRGVAWVMLYVPIAHARDRDPKACERASADLVIGSLSTVAGVLLVRARIPAAAATTPVLRSTLVTLACEAAQFDAATQPTRPRVTYACFGH